MTKLEREALYFAYALHVAPGISPDVEACIRLAAQLGYAQGSKDAQKNYPCMRVHLEEIRIEPNLVDVRITGKKFPPSMWITEEVDNYNKLIERMRLYENSFWHGSPYNRSLKLALLFFGVRGLSDLCPRCCAKLRYDLQGEYCSDSECSYAY